MTSRPMKTANSSPIVAECLEDPASFEPFVDSFIAGAAEGGTNLTRSEAQCAIRALETDGDEEEIWRV